MIPAFISRLREHPRATQLFILVTLIITLAANLYGLFIGISTAIPHLLYIPIILTAFFYPRRGVTFAIAVSAVYLLMVLVVHPGYPPDTISATGRCCVYIIVAAVISYLSERVSLRETELLQKKEEWERTFDAVPDLIALIDREHRILRVNRAMADSLGISPEQAVGMTCFNVVHHTSARHEHCPHALLLADGKEHTEEIHEDSLGGDFLVTASPFYDKSGTLIGSVHSARDITKRKRAEEALRESEEKYRTLVESSFDGIAIHQNGILVYANRTAARLLGSDDPEVFIGKSALDIVAPEFRTEVAERVQKSPEKALELIREQFLRLDGTPIDVDVTTAPSMWKGRPAAYVTFRDITERRKIERALLQKTEELDQYFSTSLDLFCIADTEGYFRRLNPQWEKTLGYTLAELEGKRFLDYVHPNDLPGTLAAIADLSSQKEVLNFTNRYRHRDGTHRWIEWRSFPKGDRIFAAARDITDRRETEEALKVALTKLNMLSSITRHDILNQVTGLRTFLELSREDLKGTRFEEFIEKEDQAAEAIQRQIEFTRYYQDIGVNAPDWQDMETTIREASSQISLQTIDLQVAVGGTEVFADPLIVKVFFNLMENSLRHGGGVTQLSFSSRETKAGLVITYRDDGAGISAEDKEKLFRKGFGKHTGLGLFLSREILAITGIAITENGEPGKGVQFEITVPVGAYRFIT